MDAHGNRPLTEETKRRLGRGGEGDDEGVVRPCSSENLKSLPPRQQHVQEEKQRQVQKKLEGDTHENTLENDEKKTKKKKRRKEESVVGVEKGEDLGWFIDR